jgi:hypothetical protein
MIRVGLTEDGEHFSTTISIIINPFTLMVGPVPDGNLLLLVKVALMIL